ncbi:protein phosphatase 1 regulatory subunit 12A [Cydia splendana]|uniref:protein phosphatase 1 regulatory subunit 12A n=1 Tax=Cydia splendana TaxID=1100963 RepID=UPI00213B76F6
MDKRGASGRDIPSILKKPKGRRKGDLLDKSTKIKREKVEGPKGEDVSAPLPQGCTPLMYACQQADYKAVVDAINKDAASVRVRDRGLRCALHYCASSGAGASQAARAACADRVLMAQPALADARDADGLTPLHLAVVHGNVPLVQTLLAAGADVNARDDEHHTVVHWATVCGEVGALRAVLAGGADAATPDQHGGYPLHYAAQMCGAPAATDHQSRGAALEVLRALVKEGGARVDVRDADGRTPLLWAASAGSAAAVLALHQAGAKVDDADRDGLTALHCAAARGHTEALETLVGLCGARVDVADSHGCTPLHYAAALGHADATAALLQHGSDAHRQDRRGRSPAHTAAAKGQIETVRILGARGTNLWLRNSKGDLPLHEAVASGRRELVKWLLDGRPSQVNATNHEGRTPLHIAAATDNADLCRLLLDRGAEVNPVARSSKNEPMTPLDCATTRGHRSTAKYLQMHGGLPASKLGNTEIVIDGAPITALPTRRVTSTKIDVRDRIRIEKREVVELSSPIHDRRQARNRMDSDSTNGSSTDDKRSRRRSDNKYTSRHQDRRKRLIEPQKSFSDGYDTELEGQAKDESYGRNHRKGSKKNRSKSEPSRRSRSNSRYRGRHRSASHSSSGSETYPEKKKSKRHRKRGRRRSTSSSESSSSESSERRSTKRKGKKTSIHIENDDEKQSVNIVKYKSADNIQRSETKEDIPALTPPATEITEKKESDKEEKQLVKSKTVSETETDTLSVKTNMIVTEAQIHMERESSQHGSSEITVTVDSSNNVSIETANLSVTHKDLNEEAKLEADVAITSSVTEEAQINDTTTGPQPSGENAAEKLKTPESQSKDESAPSKSDQENVNTQSVEKSGLESQTIEEQSKSLESDKDPSRDLTKDDKEKSKETSPGSSLERTRKKSFQVLAGPEELLLQSKDAGELATTLDINAERKDSRDKSSSPTVSFANKDEVFESKDSDKQPDHLMGEQVINGEVASGSGSVDKKLSSESTLASADEKRKEYSSTTATGSSNEIAPTTDKGLITVIDDKTAAEDRAVQKILLENTSDDINLPLPVSPKRKSSKDSQGSSRKSSIYETESYKVLSDIASVTDVSTGILKKSKVDEGSLDDDKEIIKDSFGRVASVSDNEIYSHSEVNGRRKRFRKKGRTKSRITIRSKSENSERGYESSGLMDSGFEPSPRAVQRRIMSPRLAAYYRQRNASGRYSGKSDSRIPVRKPGDKNAVDMKSVTQRIQTNMRRYYCERKIFQHLLELKRLQIRTSKTNEAVLVKRAIDEYNKSSLASVGLGTYSGVDYSFSSFEKFLYESLRKLQKSGKRHLDNLPERPIDFDYGESELYKMSSIPDNPCLCTSKTHRCFHAVHAYTGIPCSAYIPYKWNHHTMPKPSTADPSTKSKGFLPKIASKSPSSSSGKAHVTLEVSHGSERQLIALPAEKLDKNKRYYVTFTVKGSEPPSDNDNGSPSSNKAKASVRSG